LNDPNFRIDTPNGAGKLDDGEFFGEASFDVMDDDNDGELLPGIDTSKGLANSPKLQFANSPKLQFVNNESMDIHQSPTFELSPIMNHNFSPFPSRRFKREGDANKDEHFPFKAFSASPLPVRERSSNVAMLPIPPVSNNAVQHMGGNVPKTSPPNLVDFHRQQHFMNHRPPYASPPPGFRLQVSSYTVQLLRFVFSFV